MMEIVRKKWDTKLGVTQKLFTVDMLFSLILFFMTLIFVYLQKLLHCLIIYSNPLFLPCPWNFRSIGPTDFKIFILVCQYFMWIHGKLNVSHALQLIGKKHNECKYFKIMTKTWLRKHKKDVVVLKFFIWYKCYFKSTVS